LDILNYTFEHILVVLTALLISAAIGIALGIVSSWYKGLDQIILWISDVIQTIPSLALLSILMIFFGLGNTTLIAGLILYSLLPIIRNTYVGLKGVNPALMEAASGMGMTRFQRLFKVELPMSLPLIFSGIRISLVTALGTAVIGVLIGAGGLGKSIYRGIQTQNFEQIFWGAFPVVLLAIMSDFLLSKFEARLSK
jgi:osmoprotectant transport system permease protein